LRELPNYPKHTNNEDQPPAIDYGVQKKLG
jgi:hypothetical protein